MTQRRSTLIACSVLAFFALFLTFDLFTLRRYLNHAEYVNYYHAFRHWFGLELLKGHFPKWNPYWGIGDTAQIEASLPIDIFSPLEWILGPRYHLFQPLQMFAILLAGFWGFRKLRIRKAVAVPFLLFFITSPWTSYFFLYYIKSVSFLALVASFPLAYLWFRNGRFTSLAIFTWITVLFMPGTKMEYWFFHFVFFTAFGGVSYFLWPKKSTEKRRRRLILFYLSLAIAILVNSWQWIPLLQILNETKRLENPIGIKMLWSYDFYEKLWLGIRTSTFLPIFFFSLALLLADYFSKYQPQKLFRWGLLLLPLPLIPILKFHELEGWKYLSSPFGWGVLSGFLVLFTHKKFRYSTVAYFFPIAYYWCRKLPGDLHEVEVLQITTPLALKILAGLLSVMASHGANRYRLGKVGWALWCFLFVMRSQGQTVLAFFAGIMWIPTRDSFLFDYCLCLMAALGFQHLAKRRVLIPSACLGLAILVPHFQRPHYAHSMVRENQGEFPQYLGDETLREVFSQIPEKVSRSYVMDSDAWITLRATGASLTEGKNQVLNFSSLLSARYRQWAHFQTYGIRPDQNWAGYEGEYTEQTIQTLPNRNTLGYPNLQIYHDTLYAVPPQHLEPLRLLGVTHVIQPNPPMLLEGLTDYHFGKNYSVATLKNSLPRAFSLKELSPTEEPIFRNSIKHSYSKKTLQIGEHTYAIKPIAITHYEPERVVLQANVSQQSTIVLTDAYHPFWKAKVDGIYVPISPALFIFRAVNIPAGKHKIEFVAEIPFFTAAITLSLLALAVLVAITAVSPFVGIKCRPIRLPVIASLRSP